MAANVNPIFPLTPNLGVAGVLLTTAMTNTKAFDGTEAAGTAMALCYTAGANGSRLDQIRIKITSTVGAAASGTTNATLVRFWINNGAVNTTATNNQLWYEIAVPATAVTALGTSALTEYNLPASALVAIPAGYKIYAGLTVAAGGTNCALTVSAVGGDY